FNFIRYLGTSSYKITATPKNSLDAFTQFGANSVMGSINSLTMYITKAEAMDNGLTVLSQAEVDETTASEVPTINMATSKQSESMTVEFTQVTGATSYILQTKVSPSPGTVLNLQAYTDYTLSVMSVNHGAPCCPGTLNVDQVTQAMTNVTWSAARGAHTYVTSLTSPRDHALCHTLDNNCLMGCITCGTNYTVCMEAVSRTGHKSECTYHNFSS
ncbi:unnamed protein product, partial [Coregonus sp. 'balchen']